ncbi:MAG: hypothetical protein AMJ84_04565 [Acidithiobacillales bacterium SM23_46]|nr:MAG: hypothetical protein AMJ84_04565 [Acidithiobacillales bacterium SM23_46]
MSELDFRYTMPDGSQVEAFQMTEATRYQEGLWPEWMNSKMLLTSEGDGGRKKHYLNVNDVETEIPEYGWIVNRDGNISAVGYEVMETATKVTRVVPKIPDIAQPQSESALRLAAKITKRTLEDVRESDLAQVSEANQNRQALIDSMHPDDAAAQGYVQTQNTEAPPIVFDEAPKPSRLPPVESGIHVGLTPDPALLDEVKDVYRLWEEGEAAEAKRMLRQALAARIEWCSCAPGLCDGDRDAWECRQNSLLAK